MSLRLRLTLLITLLFALIFISGSYYVINNARQAVKDEVQATANLTLQLIKIALTTAGTDERINMDARVLEQIASLESTRHMRIELNRSGTPYRSDSNIAKGGIMPVTVTAPAWFTRLVKPPPLEFRHVIDEPGALYTEIIIKANPADEINEVWNETNAILGLLMIFIVLANVLVYITLGRGLAPLESILKGLEGIERGDYKLRLPALRLPELARISSKFNLMAEVLQRSREENRFLTQRSLAIQENERRNLAYELHDELGQAITAIKVVAVSIEQQSGKNPESILESASTIVRISNRMYDVARNMMRRLRPPSLDELGLVTTLQEMIDDWNSHHQETFCYFSFEGNLGMLDQDVSISLYRIAQESLTNIVKHAQASTVKIKIAIVSSPAEASNPNTAQVILTIEDDGAGFDMKQVRPGLGLLGMRERTEALNGVLTMNTEHGRGVKIMVSIPLGKSMMRAI